MVPILYSIGVDPTGRNAASQLIVWFLDDHTHGGKPHLFCRISSSSAIR